MTNQYRKKIINKISDTVIKNKNELFNQQRNRLSHFSHDLYMKLRIILNEMEYDLKILKDQNFDKEMWKLFSKMWVELVSILKEFKEEKPYLTAEKLINYVNNKNNKAIIDNLDFIIKKHLKSYLSDIKFGPTLQPVQVRSLHLLKSFVEKIQSYVKSNPLLPVPSEAPIEEPEILNKDKEEFLPVNIDTEEETYIPPAKK